MQQYIKEIFHLRLAELLDHLYFHDAKPSINIMIVVIFLMQKLYLLFWPQNSHREHSDEVYLNISGSLFSWITFQKPLEMINSNLIYNLMSIFYTILHLTMFVVFSFSLYNWQIVSKIFTFYISYYQLIILYHTEIHHLKQQNDLIVILLLGIPLYINYLIIVYCSRNYFIISQQHMLKRYSLYNYLIVLADFLYFITYSLCSDYLSKYLLLFLCIVYFIDAIIMQPYCNKINLIYIGATGVLIVSVTVRIVLWNESLYSQFYGIMLLVPLFSHIFMQIYQIISEDVKQQKLSMSLILNLGEIINHNNSNSIQKGIGDYLIKQYLDVEILNTQSILQLLEHYMKNLEKNDKWEEIQLYRILLKHEIQGTYLQSLLETKRFQIQNKNHSLFFKTIGFLISKKYDQQIQDLYSGESKTNQHYHYQIIKIKEADNLFQSSLDIFSDLLDQKILIWIQLQKGYDKIENTADDLTKMYKILNKLKIKMISIIQTTDMESILKVQTLKKFNVVELRFLSLYFSFVANDYQQTKIIEIYIEDLIKQENNSSNSSILNINIMNNDLIVICSSILEKTGQIVKANIEEISRFFGYEDKNKKQDLHLINLYMPKFISQDHDQYVYKFINKGNSTLYNKGKLVFCKDYEGFIFPIILSFLHINEKSEDFILTTALKKVQSNQDYILFDQNGKILGISKYIYSILMNTHTNNSSTQSIYSSIDQSIYECYIQFWIPNIDSLIQSSNFDHENYSINKVIIEISTLTNFIQYLYYFKQYQNINPQVQKENSYFEEFLQNIKQQLSNHLNFNCKFQFEVQIQIHQLPTGQYYYIFSMSKQYKEAQSIPSIDKKTSTYSQFQLIQQQQVKIFTHSTLPKFITDIEKITEIAPQTNRIYENQMLIKDLNQEQKQELLFSNVESQQIINQINSSSQIEKQKKNDLMEFDDQKISQSSRYSRNSNFQVLEQIREYQKNKEFCVSIKKIWIVTIFLYIIIFLLMLVILIVLSQLNDLLQYDIQLVRIPDKFNRLYCSFATMGQMDLERSLLGKDYGQYLNYRIINQASSIRNEMETMMINLKNRFSILENENRLQNLTVRILNQFSYFEEELSMIQFDMIADTYTESLFQYINQALNYSASNRIYLIDEYYKLQFIKANLINQITSSQNLIDQIIVEIKNQQENTNVVLNILLSVKLCFLIGCIFCLIQLWKQPFKIVQLQIQLLSHLSEQQIKISINSAKQAKSIINHPYRWKRTNYMNECYHKNVQKGEQDILNKIENFTKKKTKQNLKLFDYQFNHIGVYLKNCMYLLFFLSFILSSFFYMKNGIDSSQSEIQLTIQYVQFKQDLDSLMILTQLLKTNSILSEKVRQLGFLDLNPQLLDTDKYFHILEQELLAKFQLKYQKAQEINEIIFQDIVNSKKISQIDKEILQTLYQDDLCSVMDDQLPFCNFTNNQFFYFPEYPKPKDEDNNREIFRNGINGIFSKLIAILKSYYQLELQGQININKTETEYFLSTLEFKHYVLEYFFDINKAVVKFYVTILESTTKILHNDFQNTLFFYLIFGFSVLVAQGTLQISNLSKIQELVSASKFTFILMPLESLNETKCLAIIKQIVKQQRL
ncbi:unnamed protein product [Paramecium pentaurelia]|uniref:Uncharacterized protein n=1 Tax=Paramecium pentaurelia TaxID=43138 RepID=A0A8S1XDI8_9CILI|nr:unnamed protein product [Paramecium pentaurelia]